MKHAIASLFLASALAILPATSFAEDSPKRISGLLWGPITSGLQLALLPEMDAGVLHCWIRNGLREDVSYNNYFVGYWENVTLEYRKVDEWQQLKRTENEFRAYNGVLPSERAARKLAPFQTVDPSGQSGFTNARLGKAVTGSADPVTILAREDVPRPTILRATFLVDLGEFVWPAGLLDKPVEVRVVQALSGPGQGDGKEVRVSSPPTILDGSAIQRFLDLLRNGTK